jgi:hypothetical protein
MVSRTASDSHSLPPCAAKTKCFDSFSLVEEKEEEEEVAPKAPEEKTPGMAVAVMFLVWALLLLAAPFYFGLHGSARTPWFILSGVLGLIAVLGALTELSDRPGREALKPFQAVIFLAVITLLLGLPPLIWSMSEALSLALKSAGFLFALITVLGGSIEIGRYVVADRRLNRPQRKRRLGDTFLAITIGVLSLATAILGLIGAVHSKH